VGGQAGFRNGPCGRLSDWLPSARIPSWPGAETLLFTRPKIRVQSVLRVPDTPGRRAHKQLHFFLDGGVQIRSGTDKRPAVNDTNSPTVPRRKDASGDPAPSEAFRTEPARSRHVPAAVRAAVWRRDGARCGFVSGPGHRCTERSFLEFHHVQPFALDGTPTVGNIALRCRRHNQYEGELDFGARSRQKDIEGHAP
jgi:hypothetical protein